MKRWISAVCWVACACGQPEEARTEVPDEDPVVAEPVSEEPVDPEPEPPEEPEPPAITCDAPLPIYEDGAVAGEVCEEALGELSVVDLGDDWAPYLFSEDASLGDVGQQPYRPVYLALADERLDEVPDSLDHERFVELFGITPTFRVLIERLAEDERHACHSAVDNTAIAELSYTLRPWVPTADQQRERLRTLRYLTNRLARAAEEEGLSDVSGLAEHERWGPHYVKFVRLGKVVAAIEAVQEHLLWRIGLPKAQFHLFSHQPLAFEPSPGLNSSPRTSAPPQSENKGRAGRRR